MDRPISTENTNTQAPDTDRAGLLTDAEALWAREWTQQLLDGWEQLIRGKRSVLERILMALVAGSHVLLEDVPGVGKTTVVKALSRLISRQDGPIHFRRIQFTPDLLPYDLTGVDIYNPESRLFEFRPGPVFAQLVLADEINRSTPKVQSALLEVMEEAQVTVGSQSHQLGPLFMVLATQNPVEMEGTYPLPAAQLDRFLLKLSLGYPSEEDERGILLDDPSHNLLEGLDPVARVEDILRLRELGRAVHVSREIQDFILGLTRATRSHRHLSLGVSPRGGLWLLKAARYQALLQGRTFVTDQDVLDLAQPVLAHRMIPRQAKGQTGAILEEILAQFRPGSRWSHEA